MGLSRTAAVVILLALICTGCQEAGKRASLVLLNGADPETVDPSLITGQREGRIAQA